MSMLKDNSGEVSLTLEERVRILLGMSNLPTIEPIQLESVLQILLEECLWQENGIFKLLAQPFRHVVHADTCPGLPSRSKVIKLTSAMCHYRGESANNIENSLAKEVMERLWDESFGSVQLFLHGHGRIVAIRLVDKQDAFYQLITVDELLEMVVELPTAHSWYSKRPLGRAVLRTLRCSIADSFESCQQRLNLLQTADSVMQMLCNNIQDR